MDDAYDGLSKRLTNGDHELFWMLSTPELRAWAIEQANKHSRPTEGIFQVARAMVYEVTRKPEPVTPPAIEDESEDGHVLSGSLSDAWSANNGDSPEPPESWRDKRGLGDSGR